MDFKKFAKYAYILLMLFALVFTFVEPLGGEWVFWVIALLGIFVGVFGRGIEKATKLVILYLGLMATFTALSGLVFGDFTFIGEKITLFLGNMLYVTGPIILTIICFKFYKIFKD